VLEMAEEKKPQTIDDLITDKDIEERIKKYDTHMGDENQNHLLNRIIAPAVDEFYNTLKSNLESVFKNADTTNAREKLPQIRKAMIEAMKKYFEKAMPSILKNFGNIKDEEEQFKALAKAYDEIVLGAVPGTKVPKGTITMQGYMKNLKESEDKKYKDATVGTVLSDFWLQKGGHAMLARNQVNNTKASEYLIPIPQHRLAQYLRPEIEKSHEIDNEVTYLLNSHQDILHMREGVKENLWPDENKPGPKDYGLKVRVKDEKKTEQQK
jgi:hypothetical protein